jgi:hypothetical protein
LLAEGDGGGFGGFFGSRGGGFDGGLGEGEEDEMGRDHGREFEKGAMCEVMGRSELNSLIENCDMVISNANL